MLQVYWTWILFYSSSDILLLFINNSATRKTKVTFYFASFFKVLMSQARQPLVTSGELKSVWKVRAEPGSPLQVYINSTNNCYPVEIGDLEKYKIMSFFCFQI